MGLLAEVVTSLATPVSTLSTPVLVTTALTLFVVLSVILNIFNQLFCQSPNEPPLVFHWVPIIGSTITYGIDPYRFFFACREKVSSHHLLQRLRATDG